MSVCHFPSSSVAQATNVKHMRDFWREQGIKGFFPHAGPVSEVLGVQGYIVPDIIVVGTDSHVVTDGAFGAFATVIESTDMGAKVGFIAADGKTLKYIKERTNKTFEALQPDKDTQYERVVSIDVSGLEPMIACRPNPGNVRLLPEVVPVKVD